MNEINIDDSISIRATVLLEMNGQASLRDAIIKLLATVHGYPCIPAGKYTLALIATLSPEDGE